MKLVKIVKKFCAYNQRLDEFSYCNFFNKKLCHKQIMAALVGGPL